MARPIHYTQELGDKITERVASGRSLRDICTDEDIPSRTTIKRFLNENADFAAQYARAYETWADVVFDEMFEIADDSTNDWMEQRDSEGGNLGWKENGDSIRRSALRIDTRKWALARMAPKKYGDRQQIQHSGDADNPVVTEDVTDKKLAQAIAHVLSKGLHDDKPE